jgi:hypothetical protein
MSPQDIAKQDGHLNCQSLEISKNIIIQSQTVAPSQRKDECFASDKQSSNALSETSSNEDSEAKKTLLVTN